MRFRLQPLHFGRSRTPVRADAGRSAKRSLRGRRGVGAGASRLTALPWRLGGEIRDWAQNFGGPSCPGPGGSVNARVVVGRVTLLLAAHDGSVACVRHRPFEVTGAGDAGERYVERERARRGRRDRGAGPRAVAVVRRARHDRRRAPARRLRRGDRREGAGLRANDAEPAPVGGRARCGARRTGLRSRCARERSELRMASGLPGDVHRQSDRGTRSPCPPVDIRAVIDEVRAVSRSRC